jgi:hypothetical protein
LLQSAASVPSAHSSSTGGSSQRRSPSMDTGWPAPARVGCP